VYEITVVKGQLQVGEHAASARDGEDHAAQLAAFFDRDSRQATHFHFGKDFEQAQLAGGGAELNGLRLADGID
jgi:hypothetical protein